MLCMKSNEKFQQKNHLAIDKFDPANNEYVWKINKSNIAHRRAHHRISFSRSGLTIRKHTGIVALIWRLHHVKSKIIKNLKQRKRPNMQRKGLFHLHRPTCTLCQTQVAGLTSIINWQATSCKYHKSRVLRASCQHKTMPRMKNWINSMTSSRLEII